MSAAFFSLGNTARTQEDTKAALRFYQQAVGASPFNSVQQLTYEAPSAIKSTEPTARNKAMARCTGFVAPDPV